MSSDPLTAAVTALCDAVDALAAVSIDTATHPELLTVLNDLETATRKLPTQSHRIIARLHREASPTALGAKSLKSVLTTRLRISAREAHRRLAEAHDLGPRVTFTGEPLAPTLDQLAHAQAHGTIGAEHVAVIRGFFTNLPGTVDATTRHHAETTLTHIATGIGPDELRKATERLATLIDQDGPQPDDAERARRRTLTLGRQHRDGMSPLTGWVDPQWRATFEPLLAKLAAPGMANPDDHTPCTTGTPTQQQIDTDTRSAGQRTHDAFTALGRTILSSGNLGQHHGLPVTVIVSTTLHDLQSAHGSAVTGGGSLLPMSEVIRMATHAHHYLAVFDEHTQVPLYLGRTKRLASIGQRIVLHAQQRGCTVPGYGCQVHHTTGWQHGGHTNIDEEVLACPADNRLAETGWTVGIRNGLVEWTPPPHLDTGQTRTNYYHHPERLLTDPDDDDDP